MSFGVAPLGPGIASYCEGNSVAASSYRVQGPDRYNESEAGTWSTAPFESDLRITLSASPCVVNDADQGQQFVFESGCRVIQGNPRKVKETSVDGCFKSMNALANGICSKMVPGDAITCLEPGCPYKGTFKRKHELSRHMRTKHSKDEGKYPCPVSGCMRRRGRAFARLDKLTDHLLKGHEVGTPLECLELGCRPGFMTLPIWVAHVSQHGLRDVDEGWIGTIQGAAKTSCPIGDCEKSFRFRTDLKEHLLNEHSQDHRRSFHQALSDAGFNATTAEECCPICIVAIPQCFNGCFRHLAQCHIQIDKQHAELWLRAIEAAFHLNPWLTNGGFWHIYHRFPFDKTIAPSKTMSCPHCETTLQGSWQIRTHHFSMLHGLHDVRKHRDTLYSMIDYRLYQLDFARIPAIWDDLVPAQ